MQINHCKLLTNLQLDFYFRTDVYVNHPLNVCDFNVYSERAHFEYVQFQCLVKQLILNVCDSPMFIVKQLILNVCNSNVDGETAHFEKKNVFEIF